jgi:ubiquinone/menaquinone biosynthesis C-methylase UbiE
MREPTERFTDRVENYARYRPNYPEAMLQLLRTLVAPPGIVADIGSGTGILTLQLLNCGYHVFSVEPNEAMRREAERNLDTRSAFHSLVGTAESTTLADQSIDLITCAQSFHWFDRIKAKTEFRRILKTNALTALIWNERSEHASVVNREYEKLLRNLAPDYQTVSHIQVGLEEIRAFFDPGEVELRTFQNQQILSRESFLGRLLSSSYVPNLGQPGHREILEAALKLFDAHSLDEKIIFACETKVYLGQF